MANTEPHSDFRRLERRSGFNRRWIKSNYCGEERRKVKDRRQGLHAKDALVPQERPSRKMASLEKLMVSTTIQLEAVTRLLLEKGLIEEEELLEMINQVQSDYRSNVKT